METDRRALSIRLRIHLRRTIRAVPRRCISPGLSGALLCATALAGPVSPAPPWYAAWWTLIDATAIALVAIIGLLWLRTRALQAREIELECKFEERTRELRAEIEERK